MKTHWLHGNGPNHELHFEVEVEVETKCLDCAHLKVCAQAMPKRCANYTFGDSGSDCQGCIHRFTRFDSRAPVACFSCADFMPSCPIASPLTT